MAALGRAYALAGRTAEAKEQLGKLDQLAARRYVPALYRASLYLALNDRAKAAEWALKACDERSEYIIYLKVDPALSGARMDPRFLPLLRKMQPLE